MSTKNATEWLMSHKRFDAHQLKKIPNRTYSIAITSGKGGVGKTSVSIKMAKVLAEDGYRVLLVDFDTNLSNTAVKLGLPINDNFYDLLEFVRADKVNVLFFFTKELVVNRGSVFEHPGRLF